MSRQSAYHDIFNNLKLNHIYNEKIFSLLGYLEFLQIIDMVLQTILNKIHLLNNQISQPGQNRELLTNKIYELADIASVLYLLSYSHIIKLLKMACGKVEECQLQAYANMAERKYNDISKFNNIQNDFPKLTTSSFQLSDQSSEDSQAHKISGQTVIRNAMKQFMKKLEQQLTDPEMLGHRLLFKRLIAMLGKIFGVNYHTKTQHKIGWCIHTLLPPSSSAVSSDSVGAINPSSSPIPCV